MQKFRGTSRQDESRAPLARTSDLIMTENDDHLLVYDQIHHNIHDLNATASTIWRLCDGHRTIAAIQRDASRASGQSLPLETVRETLTMLDDQHLLEYPLDASVRIQLTRRASRRQVLKMGGKAAGAVIALPVITSISAPRAVAATSSDSAPINAVCTGRDETCNHYDRLPCCDGLQCSVPVDSWDNGLCL